MKKKIVIWVIVLSIVGGAVLGYLAGVNWDTSTSLLLFQRPAEESSPANDSLQTMTGRWKMTSQVEDYETEWQILNSQLGQSNSTRLDGIVTTMKGKLDLGVLEDETRLWNIGYTVPDMAQAAENIVNNEAMIKSLDDSILEEITGKWDMMNDLETIIGVWDMMNDLETII
ncbi:unnamed protein product, partial [marine sediment metagenome]